ncbi:MAG: GldG family protein [Oligoflexia bacterium]|nr:GldG family protein [Oligoflexia bacterium]
MSPWSKISLLISGFSLIILSATRFVLGTWHPLLYVFLAIFLLGFIVSVVLDYKLYLDFLSIKTAQKGLSMGWSLLIVLVFLIAVSYLGNRFNKTFDLTQEGINSLSEQSLSALKDLDSGLTFYIFYKGDKIAPQVSALKQELKMSLALYKQANARVKVAVVNAYKNPLKAEIYLADLPDKNQQELFLFVNYKDRKIRVDSPFSEEDLTSAIIKSKKREFKEILFLTGHGEKDLNDSNPSGLKILNQALTDSGFILKEWNFVQQGEPNKKISLIVSIGPRQSFLPAEKNWLKEYLSKGGNLLLSLDPKEKHGLEDFLKEYGLIFNNDFVLSQLGLLYGGPTRALGVVFDKNNPITKKIPAKQAVFFEKASSLDVEPSAFEKFKFSYLVRTHDQSFTAPQLKRDMKIGKMESLTMALSASSKKESSSDNKEEDKTFQLALFGDSDFLSNRYIYDGANRDLAVNSFVSLAGEEELVSIRPKQPKGAKISLNQSQKMGLILVYIILPLLFLLLSLWLWYKRRSA